MRCLGRWRTVMVDLRRKGRRLDYFLSSSGISDGIRGADDTTGLVNNVEG